MYRILIKHNSDKKNNLWQSYGNTISATSSPNTPTFTEFGTEDIEVLRAEVIKLDAEVGHNNIRVISDIELIYGVEIASDEIEEDTTEPSEPTEPDDASGDNTDEGDGEDTTVTP